MRIEDAPLSSQCLLSLQIENVAQFETLAFEVQLSVFRFRQQSEHRPNHPLIYSLSVESREEFRSEHLEHAPSELIFNDCMLRWDLSYLVVAASVKL